MQKLIGACLLLALIAALNTKAFAASLNCQLKEGSVQVEGIQSLQMPEGIDALILNENEVVPLEHTRIKCGRMGRQNRFDGMIKAGLQIILKSCSSESILEGQIIDSVNKRVADLVCN